VGPISDPSVPWPAVATERTVGTHLEITRTAFEGSERRRQRLAVGRPGTVTLGAPELRPPRDRVVYVKVAHPVIPPKKVWACGQAQRMALPAS
jgi:hypothetical protein